MAAPRLLPGTGSAGSGAGVLGGLPPPQGLVSVPLCPVSPPVAHTAVSTQLHSPSQAPAVPTRQASGGLVLSPDCQPIPAKLVEKARSGEYMEMREFLLDNVKLLDKLEYTGLHHGMSRPRMREVSSPLAWIHCFLAYTAIRCQDPFARDMLSYARLILGEAMCHGGTGWLEYDRATRQQRAIDPLKPWNIIDPGLHSAFILSHSTGGG
uniref:Uncharacterized protein n=1 Tax=Amphimedon queenslandica TaxID=400682 RepID=A0A1X7TZ31_AMPQE